MFVAGAYRVLGLFALLLVLLAAGCTRAPVSEKSRPNVLLIVVDTLRVDRLGCYGAERETSPAIDEFAAGAVRFERAYATAPWTIPSVASMISGRYPGSHAMISFDLELPDEVVTLAEVLRDAGYRTAGVVSHFAIDARHNFDQGFDLYLEDEAKGHGHLSTEGVTRQAVEQLQRLAEGEAPFLLFAHYFDPHYDYLRHAEYDFAAASAGRLDGTQAMRDLLELSSTLSAEEAGFLRDLYDGEIRYTDQGIGRLLERLDELGLREGTIVVITGDHGEEFLDHGNLGHTGSLYEELIRVPLIVRDAGARDEGSALVTQPVSLVSLMPTLLDRVGLEIEASGFHGPSLVPLLDGVEQSDDRALFAEVDFVPVRKGRHVGEVHKKVVIGERFKLIRDDPTGEFELYDLTVDPLETKNLVEVETERLTQFVELLERALVVSRTDEVEARLRDLDEGEIERLKGLGYVGD